MLKAIDQEVIRTMAECNMNFTEAGKKLYMHRTTVVEHANKIKKATGKDPKCFYDLMELLRMVQVQENLDWLNERMKAACIDGETMNAIMRLRRST